MQLQHRFISIVKSQDESSLDYLCLFIPTTRLQICQRQLNVWLLENPLKFDFIELTDILVFHEIPEKLEIIKSVV